MKDIMYGCFYDSSISCLKPKDIFLLHIAKSLYIHLHMKNCAGN